MRADPVVLLPAAGATLVSAATWAGWVATQASELLILAIAVQLGTGLAISLLTCRERRGLAMMIAVTVPVFGILAITWIDSSRGEGGADLLADLQPPQARRDGVKISRRLRASLPPCEAIASGNADSRRATISHLSKRAGADDIAILHWARNQTDPDLAVDAALALEDAGQRMDALVVVSRDAAVTTPSFATHAAVVRVISAGIVNGLVEPALVGRLAIEARAQHAAAIALDPASVSLIAAAYARIEIAARRPDAALAALSAAFSASTDPEILQLYNDAAYAARRFDLVSGAESSEPASTDSPQIKARLGSRRPGHVSA